MDWMAVGRSLGGEASQDEDAFHSLGAGWGGAGVKSNTACRRRMSFSDASLLFVSHAFAMPPVCGDTTPRRETYRERQRFQKANGTLPGQFVFGALCLFECNVLT